MVPTGTGEPEKWAGIFQSGKKSSQFCQDWKSRGILLKILEKLYWKTENMLEKSGKFVTLKKWEP